MSWISLIMLIFFVGGLMVSFFFMASLSHNSIIKSKRKISFIFLLIFLLRLEKMIFRYYYSLYITNHSIYINWNFIFYYVFLLLILILVFILLFFIDKKLKFLKGILKEI